MPPYRPSPVELSPSEVAPNHEGLGAFRILIPVSVAGWVLFGAACILCINGKGRAGRWVPEWYLDSAGSRRDKAAVGAWWLAVMLLWPVVLPALLVAKVAKTCRAVVVARWQRVMKKKKKGHDSDDEEKGRSDK